MFFLITEHDLEKAQVTPEAIEKLTNPEKIALITWSGEDVISDLERKGVKTDKEGLEYIIQIVVKGMEDCECSLCFESAMNYAIDDAIENKKAKR